MNQKIVNVVLSVFLLVLAFVCFKQYKTIHDIEWTVSSLEDEVYDLQKKNAALEQEIDSLKDNVDSLSDSSEAPAQGKSHEQRKQEAIEKIRRFNAEREKELEQGITNSDIKVGREREYLKLLKSFYKLDINIR